MLSYIFLNIFSTFISMKLQYFGHLMWRADSLEKTLMLGKIEGRRRGQQRTRRLYGITDSMDTSLISSRRWWRTGRPGVLQSMGLQWVGYGWTTEQKAKTKFACHYCIMDTCIFPMDLFVPILFQIFLTMPFCFLSYVSLPSNMSDNFAWMLDIVYKIL